MSAIRNAGTQLTLHWELSGFRAQLNIDFFFFIFMEWVQDHTPWHSAVHTQCGFSHPTEPDLEPALQTGPDVCLLGESVS